MAFNSLGVSGDRISIREGFLYTFSHFKLNAGIYRHTGSGLKTCSFIPDCEDKILELARYPALNYIGYVKTFEYLAGLTE